jgi:hypothetical protein
LTKKIQSTPGSSSKQRKPSKPKIPNDPLALERSQIELKDFSQDVLWRGRMYALLFGSRLLVSLYAIVVVVLLCLKIAGSEPSVSWTVITGLLFGTAGLGFLTRAFDRAMAHLFPRP